MSARVRRTTQPRSGKSVIVDSAVHRFRERGYHATTMREIADGAAINVASIYHHFPDGKQGVLRQIMADTLRDHLALTREAVLDAGSSATAQLAAVVRAWILFHTTRQAEALIGATEMRSLEGPGRELVVALRDQQEQLFREVVRRGVGTGEFATPSPTAAARAVIAMGTSVSAWYRADGAERAEDLAETYVDLALATVRAAPRPATPPDTAPVTELDTEPGRAPSERAFP